MRKCSDKNLQFILTFPVSLYGASEIKKKEIFIIYVSMATRKKLIFEKTKSVEFFVSTFRRVEFFVSTFRRVEFLVSTFRCVRLIGVQL